VREKEELLKFKANNPHIRANKNKNAPPFSAGREI
jgi:hypothetical protein